MQEVNTNQRCSPCYDQAIRLPTVDLYDDALMEMQLRAARETAARRQQVFEHYGDQAYDAYLNKRWSDVINNVNSALSTGYYNGKIALSHEIFLQKE